MTSAFVDAVLVLWAVLQDSLARWYELKAQHNFGDEYGLIRVGGSSAIRVIAKYSVYCTIQLLKNLQPDMLGRR